MFWYLIYWLIRFYILILILTAILSWFPSREGTFLFSVKEFCFQATNPLMSKVRQVIKPIGMIDVSFIVVIFGLTFLEYFIASKI